MSCHWYCFVACLCLPCSLQHKLLGSPRSSGDVFYCFVAVSSSHVSSVAALLHTLREFLQELLECLDMCLIASNELFHMTQVEFI